MPQVTWPHGFQEPAVPGVTDRLPRVTISPEAQQLSRNLSRYRSSAPRITSIFRRTLRLMPVTDTACILNVAPWALAAYRTLPCLDGAWERQPGLLLSLLTSVWLCS